ncbi:MAG: WG repeat-containing protein [Abditibacteriota bacterium]|nr:WG repeat-containing protein [Abditibacteriota bacterium]
MKRLFIVLALLFTISYVYAQYNNEEYSFWSGKDLSGGIIDLDGNEIIHPTKGKLFDVLSDTYCLTNKSWDEYGFCDKEGNEIIPVESSIEYYTINNYLPAAVGGKIGVYDLTGKLIFPFKWSRNFDELVPCFATLQKGTLLVNQDEKFGLVDLNDKFVLPLEYDMLRGDITRDLEMFIKGRKGDKYGYYDLDGSVIVPCEFDYIGEFYHSVASCMKGNNWYVINTKGEIIFGPTAEYERIYSCDEDTYFVQKKGKIGIIDKGSLVMPCEYEGKIITSTDSDPTKYDIDGNSFQDIITLKDDSKQFVFDDSGNLLFSCSLEYNFNRSYYSEGMISFMVKGKTHIEEDSFSLPDDYKIFQTKAEFDEWTKNKIVSCCLIVETNQYVLYVNDNGEKYKFFNSDKEVEKYAFAHNIEFGNVQVEEVFGLMDSKGNIVLKPEYEGIDKFIDGYARATNFEYDECIINTKGEMVIPFYDDMVNAGNGYFICQNYGDDPLHEKCGVVNKDNKVIIDFMYDEIEEVEGRFVVKRDYQCQLFNNEGKPISKKYDRIETMGRNYGDKSFLWDFGEKPKPQKYLAVVNGTREYDKKMDMDEDHIGVPGMASLNLSFIEKIKLFFINLFS